MNEGEREIKWLRELSELLKLLSEDPEFYRIHTEAVEKLLRYVKEEVQRAREAWRALSDEDKLHEIAAKAPWRKSAYGDGEYVAAELVPTLMEAVKAKGKLYASGYVYVLSKNGKWIQRFPRGERK